MRRLFGGTSKSNNEALPNETSVAIVEVPNQGTAVGLTSTLDEQRSTLQPSALQEQSPQRAAPIVQTHQPAEKKPIPKNRNVNVVEMLEFVKSLEVDPVKESEMLWIAEEAYQAQLPPGWEEHTDEHGRPYFHNMATGESCWQHPMDGLFKQIIEYWRRVQASGGFWEIEDELKDYEEQIRIDLQYWMELFDEHGDKFYYNKRTEESRFDDPRNGVYHDLYARIRMVAKMKERLPLLAQAPRPEDASMAEMQLQKQMQEQQEATMDAILRIQSAARALLAKRKVRGVRERNLVGRGYQPLRGQVELRLRKGNRGKEVVLKTTGSHRQFKAAQKIQAKVRSVQTRSHLGPVVAHRAYLNRQARVIQTRARVFLKRKREQRETEEREQTAATLISSSLHIILAREYVKNLKAGRKEFDKFVKAAITIQCLFRRVLATRKVQRMKDMRDEVAMKKIQSCFYRYNASCHVIRCQQEEEPFEAMLRFTQDEAIRGTVPVTWKLIMHPLDHRGHAVQQSCYSRACDSRDEDNGLKNYQPVDLFSKIDPLTYAKRQASVKMQAIARAFLVRRKTKKRCEIMNSIADELNSSIYNLIDLRYNSAVRIQSRVRGIAARKLDIIGQGKRKWQQKIVPKVEIAQAYLRRLLAQSWLTDFTVEGNQEKAAIIIQTAWRGWLARRQVERMTQIVLFPMVGWFSYQGTGRDAVRMDVQFVPNSKFDEFKHFCKYGSMDDLYESLDLMERDVSEAQRTCDMRYAERDAKEQEEAKAKEEEAKAKEEEAKAKEEQDWHPEVQHGENFLDEIKKVMGRMPKPTDKIKNAQGEEITFEEFSALGEAEQQMMFPIKMWKQEEMEEVDESAPSNRSSKKPSRQPSRQPSHQTAKSSDRDLRDESDGVEVATSSRGFPEAGTTSVGLASSRSDPPKSPSWLKTQESLMNGSWSPRRGHLIHEDSSPREREEKQRNLQQDLPGTEPQPLSPMTAPIKRATSSHSRAASSSRSGDPGRMASSQSQRSARSQASQRPEIQASTSERSRSRASERSQSESVDEDKKSIAMDTALPKLDSSKSLQQSSRKPPERPAVVAQPIRQNMTEEKPRNQSALGVLQGAAQEGGFSSSSRTPAPKKNYAGAFVNGQFVKSHRKVEDLTEEEQAQVIKDLQDERRSKVEELIRRQKKHAAKRKKEQKLEAEKLGQNSGGQFFEDENRRRKVRELKRWLKKKETEEQARAYMSPLDKAKQALAEDPHFAKLKQVKEEFLYRRADIQEGRLKAMGIQMDPVKTQNPSRVLHRHVHHHVHYHDGVSDDEQSSSPQLPMMKQSASDGAFRTQPGQVLGSSGSQVPTASMPWRPLIHSASAGQVPPPSKMMPANPDPYGMMRTVEAFRQAPPGVGWQHGSADPQGYPQGVLPPPLR